VRDEKRGRTRNQERKDEDAKRRKERKRDIQKSSVADQSEYPINKSSYPAIQSQHMHPGIWIVPQYSNYQLLFPSLSLSFSSSQEREKGVRTNGHTAGPTNSLIIGYETTGAKTAHSTTCS